ncbi:TPR-like protein [Lichtheimia hyalospora FSU 10163]|nr:TPR-like protein [Lichtheimia hyalospora FSU 10163]
MYGAKGASLINTVARQSALSKQLAAGHSSKSTAFLTNLSTRNVSAGKLSYTTSRASQHLNKSSQQDDNQQQEYRRMHRSNSGWHQLAKISQLPTASRHQQARFNHQMAAANGKDESIVPTEVNNRIMQAHKAHDPERVVAEFVAGRTAGAPLSTQTYDAVLDAYGTLRKHNQSVKAMCEVYDDMIANGVHPTSHAYATLLKSLCNRDNEVNRLVNTLRHKKARYGTKIDSLGALENESNDNVERAVALFQRAVQEQQTEDFDVDLYNRMLNMLSVSGNTKDALYIYETLEESATAKPDSQTFTMLINMYGYAGDMSKAHECFSEYLAMSSHLPKHDPAHVYNAYVFAHVDAGDFDGAMEVVRTIRANNVRVNIRPYNKIINGAASKENMAVIEQVLEELRQDPSLPKPDANTYGPLLSMYARQGDYDKATEQLERLLEHDLSRQYGRIADYVCLCRSQKQPDRALDVLKRANTRGMSVDVDLIREVLNGYIESGRYTHVDQAFETLAAMYAKTNFIDNKSPLTHMASDLAIKNNHLKISVSLLRQMYKYSVRMSPPLASNILQQYDAAKKDTAQWKEFSSSADSRDYGILYEALFRTIDERDQFADRIFQLLDDVRILNIPLSMPNLYVRVMTHLNRLKKPDAQARWQKEFEPFLQATEEAAASPSASTSSASSVTSAANMESGLQSGAALGLAVKGDLKGAIGVLEQQILGKGLLPKPNVVRDMIQQATRYKDIASAQRIYDLTKDSLGQWVANSSNNSQQRHAVQNVLNSMLIAYARAEDVPRAKEFYDELRARDMVPDGDGYASLLACTPNSTADESTDALDIYDEAMKHHVRPTVYFYNVIMSKLAKCRKIELVLQFFDEMKRNRVAPNSITYAAVITACLKCSSDVRAERYFHEMLGDPRFQPRIGVFNSMIQFYAQQKPNREKALEYFHLLQRYRLQPSAHTFRLLIEVHANITPFDMVTAHRVLTDMERRHGVSPGPTHYATLIRSYGCLHRDVPSAEAVYNEMRKARVRPDDSVYQAMFSTYIENNDLESAERLYGEMRQGGAMSSAYIENLFIAGYGTRGMMDKAEERWNKLADVKQKTDRSIIVREPSTYEAMVKAYLANNQQDKAASIVKQMQGARNFPVKIVEAVHQLLNPTTTSTPTTTPPPPTA